MKIVLIGAGNVATVLGKLFYNNGHEIVQIAGRNIEKAELLANALNSEAIISLNNLTHDADLYIIAIPDDAVPSVAETLRIPNKMVVHTAGTLQLDSIKKISENIGVIWPLQSLKKEIKHLPDIPFVIDGNSLAVTETLKIFLNTVTDKVIAMKDEERKRLHLTAVMVSNFSNHLYTLAQDYCNEYHLPFNYLIPLIKETALRLNLYEAKDVQTGPSVRGDNKTIDSHLTLLENNEQLKTLYKEFDKSIRQRHNWKAIYYSNNVNIHKNI